jgi:hypothetical protein
MAGVAAEVERTVDPSGEPRRLQRVTLGAGEQSPALLPFGAILAALSSTT